ncbi:similar to Saccharomyces cerevisiae YBR208C DUR1,2 Urea amidolyase, contains both urea carboxylase and allophanate hydrolase activities, degrades urea to CO2 and NH3 [Maudiozyma barnettii]|uniref:Urea amidolyase n=1 Tax=Maudiozyma barnettii TaxID=61262 RepID=A0A8H2VDT7_9SACH|nr:bifunctional urea carboxylase/allophanate hydrolase [Kazachstania barnettii]CAB4253695.1 similar to Saccharomyces cerevisiae YBR208C DUR1,2 Urea amidolyase, contains both urea carboxylase and allophanate hydrolase activities, degrades urea to CO2 and NH3 [Kazachstania barnettii]CAD1781422.1 similar to Saccharomyces cerevisiae YBR208C DUR1,2 Urea amidolyase, contains both urea carboxylase and allophanate hydrolase activities, degrades urea to CO2 and NH3 [Kazachstania barnettii]
MSPDTLGWTAADWVTFHQSSTPTNSYSTLLALIKSQKVAPEDTAWISIVSVENLRKQWMVLQTRDDHESLPLFGVPVAIKDNIDARGFATTAACPSYSYHPKKDATVVRLLRDAGAIIIGKTNLDQFATGLVGTRSPYGKVTCAFNNEYVSGGSSAGSAKVVATGIVPIALGTDTAGSGRVPAALNNLIGLKPSKGIFSCNGVVPACKSLDCVSIFSLNLPDAELCFKILCKPDAENDEYSRPFPSNPLRKFGTNVTIAIPKDIPWYGEVENPKLYRNAIEILKKTGANIKILDLEPLLDLARCLYEGPWVAERYQAVGRFLESNPPVETLDPTVTEIIKGGEPFRATDFFKYEYKRNKILQSIQTLLQGIDVVCVPTCPLNPTLKDIENEPILVNSRQGTWTNFVNLADLAALAVPAGFRPDGLPNGITLLGKKFSDYALLELAERYLKQLFPTPNRPQGIFTTKETSRAMSNLQGPMISSDKSDYIKLAVIGAHLKDLPLHWQLEKVNATFISETKTSRNYKLYALPRNGPILKPGLRRVAENTPGSSSIALEIYAVPTELFGQFIAMVPEPLGIGSVELENGEWIKSFICEEFGYDAEGSVDITLYGGFKAYIEHLNKEETKSVKPFERVLIANRGEIAVRIISTLRKLDITSIAIYSDPDEYSQHVEDADISIPLHGSTASETYLDIEKVIKGAKEYNADAIIPGYGFLSENADFADRCEQEGIVFVGPSGDIIRQLGLKHSAREIAEDAGVPLVPGSPLISELDKAVQVARTIGYPIMVKSTAGGGGIGLKRVDSEEELKSVFATVQHQGKSYFGNAGVFLEKFIENARHVEIQIMGDGCGNAIALGERDCSLQRRNQKVIEETPAPNLSEKTRKDLKMAAESLACQLKYKTAGTVEFIYDEKSETFYFLEVNTRLQVEHPVTEMVTGLDLVEMMIKIAADDPPDFSKLNVSLSGASMEARLYAENPVKDFRPSPGQIVDIEFPKWARVDTWVKKGTIVSSEYDPLIAKIIVYGKDRSEALSNLNKALQETKVYGCVTNIGYLRSIASSSMFENVALCTSTLNSYTYDSGSFEIILPGAHTSIQGYPGRKGYWRIGVPPSGPMDSYSFRLANRIVGNNQDEAGIEITLTGPTIKFNTDTIIAIAGGFCQPILNGEKIEQFKPTNIKAGDTLAIGKLQSGCRSYLAIRGSIDVPKYLGSKSTFTLGEFGGNNGRVLKTGDVLFLQPSIALCDAEAAPLSLIPKISTKNWTIGVTCGPHGSPDIFKEEYIKEFLNEKFEVHYNSNRFGVRLIGPKPKWSRTDGGEGGLHPSNAHDYVYSLGAINFTGDEPVIITCDGPSLGGFVCAAVIPEGELWKVGQVKQGDQIRFVPISYDSARSLQKSQDIAINEFNDGLLEVLDENLILSAYEDPVLYVIEGITATNPKVTYRQAGDRYVLVEYGEISMDLNLSYRIHSLIKLIEKYKTVGIIEMSQGVRSVLIEFDGYKMSQQVLLEILIAYEDEINFDENWKVESKVFKLPVTFEDSKTLECVTRYKETIRSTGPWLPNNVDFIAGVNNIDRKDVHDMVFSARFMVLGLGDVFLGSPCAVPLDPRQRFLGSKYNPSRSYTEKGLVGLGGMYMCIYAASSPGGYQLVGRTIPIWDKLSLEKHTSHPWLVSPFDQIEFYEVNEARLDSDTRDWENGKFDVQIEETLFDHREYLNWIEENKDSIHIFQQSQDSGLKEKFIKLIEGSDMEVKKSGDKKIIPVEEFPENTQLVYSEFAGRFWKNVVSSGDYVKEGEALIIIEAMKTEMIVAATTAGKVLRVFHENGDIVNSGDPVVIIESC